MMSFALAVNFVLFMSTSVNSFLNLNGWILPSSAQVPASVLADLVLFPTNPSRLIIQSGISEYMVMVPESIFSTRKSNNSFILPLFMYDLF